MNGHCYLIAMTRQGFIHSIINRLKHHVVQAAAVVGVADIHTGALSDCLQSL